MGFYQEREAELISRIGQRKQPNEPFDTVEQIRQRERDFKRLVNDTDVLYDYGNAMDKLEKASRMASIYFPGDGTAQYEHIRGADMRRKDAHNDAIFAIQDMNALYESYGMPPFLNLTVEQLHDPRHRYDVTMATNEYLQEMTGRDAQHANQQMQMHEAKVEFERQAEEQDEHAAREQFDATITLTEGKEWLYDPEYAEVLKDNPELIDKKTQQAIDRGIERRRQDEAKIRPELAEDHDDVVKEIKEMEI